MMSVRSFATAGAFVLAAILAQPAALAQTSTSRPAPAQSTSKPATQPAKPKAAAKPQPKPAAKPATPAAQPATAPAKPAEADEEPTLLGQYGEWGAYSAAPNGKKVCFALAKPGSSQTNPPNRPRDPAYLFVSTRPAEKVKDEVSVIIGYSFKSNSEASAAIGSATFPMHTQEDGAWIKNAADEAKMVEALRKGADVVIKGTSSRGTQTTDTFSLKGLTQALDRIGQECK